jgi:hypothetical protein
VFVLCVIPVNKVGTFLRGALKAASLKGKAQDILISLKNILMTNTLFYFATTTATKRKRVKYTL